MPMPARFMGSPVAFAGFVAMTSEDGDTFMLKAGPAHEIVRTNSVDEAGLFVARDCQWAHLHPRRQASDPRSASSVARRERREACRPTAGSAAFDPAGDQAANRPCCQVPA